MVQIRVTCVKPYILLIGTGKHRIGSYQEIRSWKIHIYTPAYQCVSKALRSPNIFILVLSQNILPQVKDVL